MFNSQISERQWPYHIIKLTDFWIKNLFGVHKFKGSPAQKRLKVHKNLEYRVTHFF
jgi:hemoglobin